MSGRSQVLDDWARHRTTGRLGTLLPQCVDRVWGEGDEAAGFVTTDYRVLRDFPLGRGGDRPVPAADLIELYWSVRTRGGRQDPNWAPALNAHVVQVVDESVSALHVDQLYRLAVVLRKALQLGAIGPLVADAKAVALHVRGLLLGGAPKAPAAIVERLASHADLPLTVGRYLVAPDGSVEFAGGATDSRHWEAAADDAELTALGQRLVQHDQLIRTAGVWTPDPGHDWNDDGTVRPARPGRRSRR